MEAFIAELRRSYNYCLCDECLKLLNIPTIMRLVDYQTPELCIACINYRLTYEYWGYIKNRTYEVYKAAIMKDPKMLHYVNCKDLSPDEICNLYLIFLGPNSYIGNQKTSSVIADMDIESKCSFLEELINPELLPMYRRQPAPRYTRTKRAK